MSAIIFGLMTLLLILISGFLVLIILMQRASSNSGMGSALGGGAAESALGAGAGNVLTKGTIFGAAGFFILSFGLYLALLSNAENTGPLNSLPVEELSSGEADATPAPASPLVNLPEGLESSALQKQLESLGAATTEVSTDQGTMIITEDSVPVKGAEAAESVAPAAEEAASTEKAPVEAATESTEAAEPAETNGE